MAGGRYRLAEAGRRKGGRVHSLRERRRGPISTDPRGGDHCTGGSRKGLPAPSLARPAHIAMAFQRWRMRRLSKGDCMPDHDADPSASMMLELSR